MQKMPAGSRKEGQVTKNTVELFPPIRVLQIFKCSYILKYWSGDCTFTSTFKNVNSNSSEKMKSVFDKATRAELINRINTLNENSKAQWGKMNVSQMLKHCTQFEEMSLGKKKYKQSFLGKLFGKMALKDMLKDEPVKRNLPTVPSFKVKENSFDLANERKKWVDLIKEYEHFSNSDFVHPFFGKMTKKQTCYLAYKHTDHHLRQFNA